MTGTWRLNWSATCCASLKLRGMTRWTWTSESPLPTGRSVRVRVAEIGSSSAKMSSISSRRARREGGGGGARGRGGRAADLGGFALPRPFEEVLRAGVGIVDLVVLGTVVVILGKTEVDQR